MNAGRDAREPVREPSREPPPRRLALITARGGSKRLPGKNVRDFHGEPILAHVIRCAHASALFSTVMVSTDDVGIARVAERHGASVPFLRSARNADDHASTAAVVHEVLDVWRRRGERYDECCCLYPTAALLVPETLVAAHALMHERGHDMVFPVVPFPARIERALRVDGDGRPAYADPAFAATRSQDLEDAYHDAGQFYWVRVAPFLRRDTLMSDDAGVVVCDPMQVQDIDTEADWRLAELKYRLRERSPRA